MPRVAYKMVAYKKIRVVLDITQATVIMICLYEDYVRNFTRTTCLYIGGGSGVCLCKTRV